MDDKHGACQHAARGGHDERIARLIELSERVVHRLGNAIRRLRRGNSCDIRQPIPEVKSLVRRWYSGRGTPVSRRPVHQTSIRRPWFLWKEGLQDKPAAARHRAVSHALQLCAGGVADAGALWLVSGMGGSRKGMGEELMIDVVVSP